MVDAEAKWDETSADYDFLRIGSFAAYVEPGLGSCFLRVYVYWRALSGLNVTAFGLAFYILLLLSAKVPTLSTAITAFFMSHLSAFITTVVENLLLVLMSS